MTANDNWNIKTNHDYFISGVGDGVTYGVYRGGMFTKHELVSTHTTLKEASDAIDMYKETDKQDMKNVK
jgi:hypothetical protein